MSLKWIGSRIGVLDKYLGSPCIIRNRGLRSELYLLGKLHRELVRDFRSTAKENVAQGTECPTTHNLSLPDTTQSLLHEKSY